ncbi:uncharacterized protein TrAtP1_000091 [Trichoderma atroviride]|uniref:uncharacterized protein n=1 Tax=Hypocrea atroviridis TaxID=63577 RepID=UPI0033172CD0|nr:hypothetical protein TrAtP1_000091 [Trichoderma atroviride]
MLEEPVTHAAVSLGPVRLPSYNGGGGVCRCTGLADVLRMSKALAWERQMALSGHGARLTYMQSCMFVRA